MRDALTLTCTDDGQHPACEIAQIVWQPLDPTEGVVYDLEGAHDDVPVAKPASARSTTAGRDRHVDRAEVRIVARSGGGQTFHFPRCPRCGKTPPPMRDDTVNKLRSCEGPSFDVYLLRR